MTKQEKNRLKQLNRILKQGGCLHLPCEDCYPYRAGNCPYTTPVIHSTTPKTEEALKADIKKLIINDKYHCTIKHTEVNTGVYQCSIVIKQKWHFPKTYAYVWNYKREEGTFETLARESNLNYMYCVDTKEEVQKEAEKFVTRYMESKEFKSESETVVYKYGENK